MDYVFYQAAAINGFDALGHYLRAELIVNQCSTYAIAPVAGCSSNYPVKSSGSATASTSTDKTVASVTSAVGDDPVLRATAEALAKALGDEVAKVKKQHSKSKKRAPAKSQAAREEEETAKQSPHAKTSPARRDADAGARRRRDDLADRAGRPERDGRARRARPTRRAPTATPTPTPTPNGTGDSLLDYLFGGGNG